MSIEREIPPPVHTSRDPWPRGFPVPGPAAKLARGAEAAGWNVTCTYAQGYALPVKHVDPPYQVATVAVRFWRDLGDRKRGGWVVYHQRLDRTPAKWEAKSLLVWGADHWPVITGLGVTEVGRYLVDGPDWDGADVAAWRVELFTKVARAAARAKEKAAVDRLKLGARGKVI